MIEDLDDTISALLTDASSLVKSADVRFDIPDAAWRSSLGRLTVNCYLYDVRENLEMRTHEPLTARPTDPNDRTKAKRIRPPVRVDCSYCITAWSAAQSDAVREEHALLSQVLRTLLRNPTIPSIFLKGSLTSQLPPYPTVIASRDGVKNQPEFWNALDQRLEPSLNYVVTLAMPVHDVPTDADLPSVVKTVNGAVSQAVVAPAEPGAGAGDGVKILETD